MVLTPRQRRAIDRRVGAPGRLLVRAILSARLLSAALPWTPAEESDIFTATFRFLAKAIALVGLLLAVLVGALLLLSLID